MRPNGLRIHETQIPNGRALPSRSPQWRTPLTARLRPPYGRAGPAPRRRQAKTEHAPPVSPRARMPTFPRESCGSGPTAALGRWVVGWSNGSSRPILVNLVVLSGSVHEIGVVAFG